MKQFLVLSVLIIISQPFCIAQVPDWATGVVWYQIFPERFSNGDPTNDPEVEKAFINSDSIPMGWKIKDWTSNWFSQDVWEKDLGGHFRSHLYERRYGGDIRGIIDHLDYLKELGIGAIYLNPIFEAASLHKYDGSTFHHIDVNFGPDPDGDRELIKSETPDDPSPGGDFNAGYLIWSETGSGSYHRIDINVSIPTGWKPRDPRDILHNEFLSKPEFVCTHEVKIVLPTGEERLLSLVSS